MTCYDLNLVIFMRVKISLLSLVNLHGGMGGFPKTPLVPQTVSSCSKTTILRTCTQGEDPLGELRGFLSTQRSSGNSSVCIKTALGKLSGFWRQATYQRDKLPAAGAWADMNIYPTVGNMTRPNSEKDAEHQHSA